MTDHPVHIVDDDKLGEPLAPWTYRNPEFFQLEYDAFFLSRWQWVCHIDDLAQPGDYFATDIGLDSVFVVKDKSQNIRGFQNVCRHRASRILEGQGHCRGVICCPYHGWTYRLDGSLMAVPQQNSFRNLDKPQLGLKEIDVEVFNGLVFIKVNPGGPSVSEMFSHTNDYFEQYDVANYEKIHDELTEVWDVNWKVAWDNYLENYHIPVGHPGLHRLVTENNEYECLSSGVDYGTFSVNTKPSKIPEERQYQSLFPTAQARLPEKLRDKWVQFGVEGNLGIDLYPEMLDMFQLCPLGPEKTLIRSAFYGHKDATPDEQELRRLNMAINSKVNDEDRALCTRVQQGLRSHAYQPGPLSEAEIGVFRFHESVRSKVPVAKLINAPPVGSVALENKRLADSE
ncbi:MAG: aromatic ring-hydroxylating dioxygenase subunit alpha [Pseudomonadota bacterium]